MPGISQKMQVLAEIKSLFHALHAFYKEIENDIRDCCLFTEFYKPDKAFAYLSSACQKLPRLPVYIMRFYTIPSLVLMLILILTDSAIEKNYNTTVAAGLVWWYALIIFGWIYAVFAWIFLAMLRMPIVLCWALANKINSR